MQHLRRIACLLILALPCAIPASAGAVGLGQTAPPGSAAGCVQCTVFQVASGATSPSYVVPAGGGTITSWSVQGAPTSLSCLLTGCSARLQVFRPSGGSYSLAGQSSQETIPAGKLSTFSTSVPVRAGDVLGLAATQVPLTGAGAADDIVGTLTGSLPVPGDAIDFATGGGLINLSVTLDPTVASSGSGNTRGSGSTAVFAGSALASRVVRVSRSGVARIVVRCPTGAVGACAGRLVLRYGRVGLGHASFRVPAGSRGRVNLHVSKKGRTLLRRSALLAARASVSSHDGSGQRKATAAALTLKRAQPKTTRTTR